MKAFAIGENGCIELENRIGVKLEPSTDSGILVAGHSIGSSGQASLC